MAIIVINKTQRHLIERGSLKGLSKKQLKRKNKQSLMRVVTKRNKKGD